MASYTSRQQQAHTLVGCACLLGAPNFSTSPEVMRHVQGIEMLEVESHCMRLLDSSLQNLVDATLQVLKNCPNVFVAGIAVGTKGTELEARAAEIAECAQRGQLLVDLATSELVRRLPASELHIADLGTFRGSNDSPMRLLRIRRPPLHEAPASNQRFHNHAFVGRSAEIAKLRDLMDSNRLVSITGGGGVGKSRLLQRIASEGKGHCVMLDAHSFEEAELFYAALFRDLEARKWPDETYQESCLRVLATEPCTVFIDSHHRLNPWVRDAVQTLLEACAHVRIVAASVMRLKLAEEVVLRLEGMNTDADIDDFEGISACEAVQLFVECALGVDAKFKLVESNARYVLSICTHLEGNPLLIEMAAMRTNTATPAQIYHRLSDRLVFFNRKTAQAGQRERLRAVLASQFEYLSEEAQALFAALSICHGAFSIDVAKLLCPEIKGVEAAFEELVETVWIKGADIGSNDRWFLIGATLQLFGRERQAACHGAPAQRSRIRNRLKDYALDALQSARLTQSSAGYEILAALVPDIIDRLHRAIEKDWSGDGLQTIVEFFPLLYSRGHFAELKHITAFANKKCRDQNHPARARLLNFSAAIEAAEGNFRVAGRLATDSYRLAKRHQDSDGIARALNTLGRCAHMLGLATSWALHRRSASLNRQSGNSIGELTMLANGLGTLMKSKAWMPVPELDRFQELLMEVTDPWVLAASNSNLAEFYTHRGELELAASHAVRACSLALACGAKVTLAYSIRILIWAIGEGEPERAARLYGVCLNLQETLPPSVALGRPVDDVLSVIESIRVRLGNDNVDNLINEGESVSVQYAFDHWIA